MLVHLDTIPTGGKKKKKRKQLNDDWGFAQCALFWCLLFEFGRQEGVLYLGGRSPAALDLTATHQPFRLTALVEKKYIDISFFLCIVNRGFHFFVMQ